MSHSRMGTVHFVLPNDIDDPSSPSGGNSYDRRVADGLVELGWTVREHAVWGGWPRPSEAERAGLARVLAALPDNAVALVDGLIASAVPEVLVPESRRLRVVALVHMPLGDAQERDVLQAVDGVVTTSHWSRRHLIDRYGLAGARIRVASPGADPAPLAPGTAAGSALLCVAAVCVHKGHDVLARALAAIPDRPWQCDWVGSLDRDPAFVAGLRAQLAVDRIAGRVSLVGARTGADLDAHYAAADLLVLASRGETYGMVVAEALARGTPVIATAVGGVPEALGGLTGLVPTPDDGRPGMLVAPDDPAALAGALRRWLDEPALREGLRASAAARRTTLTGWGVTATQVSRALAAIPTKVGVGR